MENRSDFENETQRYAVSVVRNDASSATAHVRQHSFTVNIKRGGGEAGPNAAEVLLSALGTCLLTNVETLAEKMRIEIEEARVEIEGVRRNVPPGLIGISYRLILRSNAPTEKLARLHEKAFEWGTVTNTLANGVPIDPKLLVEKPRR